MPQDKKEPMRKGGKTGPSSEEFKSIVDKVKNDATKEELELMETYRTLPQDLVPNVIAKTYRKTIEELQDIINNYNKYGNPLVYKTIPKRMEDVFKNIESLNKTYLPSAYSCRRSKEVVLVPSDYEKCVCCKRWFSLEEFNYKTMNVNPGGSYYCSECASKLLKEYIKKYGDIRESLILLSQKIDLIVLDSTLTGAAARYDTSIGHAAVQEGTFVGWYVGTVRADCDVMEIPLDCRDFQHSRLAGVPFKMIKDKFGNEDIYSDTFLEEDDDDEEIAISKTSIKNLKRKWGDFPVKKLEWLAAKEMEWYDNYDIAGKNRELLVSQMCFEEYEIYEKRQLGEDCDQNLKNLQALMKQSELSPKIVSSSSNSEFQSLGEFIKTVEQKKPFINKDPEFEDVDGIHKLWQSMVGALCRTLGKESPYIDVFNNTMSEYTIDEIESSPSTQKGE